MPTIIIPYRNRQNHLEQLLPTLQNKVPDWDILIVEQADDEPFNRGKLLNIGFLETKDTSDYYVFHDVDMVPINNPYKVAEKPVSFVKSATQFEKGRPYDSYFGGVTGINKRDFLKVNGYYNNFWGYGAEDDHFAYKLAKNNIEWSILDGEFESLQHKSNQGSEEHRNNANLYNTEKEKLNDGVRQCLYDLEKEEKKGQIRHIWVNTKPIVKTITITAYNRPQYFKQICESLRKNDLRGWRIVVAFEPSDKFEEQKQILDTILNDNDEIWRAVWYKNAEKYGVRKNPYEVLNYVFNFLGSEINIYLEDDIIISPDVTKMAKWFNNLEYEKELLAIKLVNEMCHKLTDNETLLLCQNEFAALGLIIKKEMWFKYFQPSWFKDIGEWQGHKRVGWDWMIHRGILERNDNLYTLMPINSRSNHIGREGGTHCTPQGHDQVFGNVVINDVIPNNYKIVEQQLDQTTPTF